MPSWRDLGNIWNTFKELDIRPIAADAERTVALAVVGAAGVGKSTLIHALRAGNLRSKDKYGVAGGKHRARSVAPVVEADLNGNVENADLIILMLDATRSAFPREAELFRAWEAAGKKVVVFYNKMDLVTDAVQLDATLNAWAGGAIVFASALDRDSLAAEFAPAILSALPNRFLALARRFPLLRSRVARQLINDTSFANATYALGTGFAEMIPALDIPFNVADIIILTKNQALMVYKLGLALGYSTRWQEHVAEFGGVIGTGFLWRQIARQLVGLIPGWGIVPKVAIAYAGTFAVGEAILRWYETGRKISRQDMQRIYADALAQGKAIAQGLITRVPKVQMPKVQMPARPQLKMPRVPRLSAPKSKKGSERKPGEPINGGRDNHA